MENPLPSDDQENEDVTLSSRHKKFASKFLNKLNRDSTPTSNTEEDDEISNDSSNEQVEIA
jgi:hypothetical protein